MPQDFRFASLSEPTARAYVENFIHGAGYSDVNLTEGDINWVLALLARAEEFGTSALNNDYNWELSFSSLKRREQHLSPVVEEQMEAWVKDGKLKKNDVAGKWPYGKRFAVCLTHDIDVLHYDPLKYAWRASRTLFEAPARQRALIAGRMAKLASQGLRRPARKSPPLHAWLEIEDNYSFHSTLHFMANSIGRCWDDGYYFLDDCIDFQGARCTIARAASIISKAGWDVGLHGGSASFADPELLRKQKSLLEGAANISVSSARQHHLRFDIRRTPEAQFAAGLRADSTIGSNQNTDFRCGTGLPFYVFSFERGCAIDLLEIPLIVQDVALGRQRGYDEELMVRAVVELLERVAKVNGCITLLWHNHFLPNSLEFRVYHRVLEKVYELGGWGCSMKELSDWWRKRAPFESFGQNLVG